MLNNQGLLFEDSQAGIMSSEMGFCLNPMNLTSNLVAPLVSNQDQQYVKPFINNIIPSSFGMDHVTSTLTHSLLSSTSPKPREDFISSFYNMPQLVSPQRFTSNMWVWGEGKEGQGMEKGTSGDNNARSLGVSMMKMKKIKGRRKVREPRFCFKTMSDVDVLDDGYKWRKYGQKVVKNTLHPRSYYRCTQDNCRVKKRVERLAEDPRMVITTYEGRHVHSPSRDQLDESQPQPLLNNFFC
uniref:WRKY domain-containing protein n=1 Tax=Opuntia streptacantha TaxID=393608 RepID=A0A7C8ZKF1_OPUST